MQQPKYKPGDRVICVVDLTAPDILNDFYFKGNTGTIIEKYDYHTEEKEYEYTILWDNETEKENNGAKWLALDSEILPLTKSAEILYGVINVRKKRNSNK